MWQVDKYSKCLKLDCLGAHFAALKVFLAVGDGGLVAVVCLAITVALAFAAFVGVSSKVTKYFNLGFGKGFLSTCTKMLVCLCWWCVWRLVGSSRHGCRYLKPQPINHQTHHYQKQTNIFVSN